MACSTWLMAYDAHLQAQRSTEHEPQGRWQCTPQNRQQRRGGQYLHARVCVLCTCVHIHKHCVCASVYQVRLSTFTSIVHTHVCVTYVCPHSQALCTRKCVLRTCVYKHGACACFAWAEACTLKADRQKCVCLFLVCVCPYTCDPCTHGPQLRTPPST